MDDISCTLNFQVHIDAMQWLFLNFLSHDAREACPLELFYDREPRRLGGSDLQPHVIPWRSLAPEIISGDIDVVDKSCSIGFRSLNQIKVAALNSGYVVGDNHCFIATQLHILNFFCLRHLAWQIP